jgi:dihydrolipoamide dehydrogenase
MSQRAEVRVPGIGDFKDVPIIEVHVRPGQTVAKEDPLVTLESDKATMDVPSPHAGVVSELRVTVGDRVSEGTLLLTMEMGAEAVAEPSRLGGTAPAPRTAERMGQKTAATVPAAADRSGVVAASPPRGERAVAATAPAAVRTASADVDAEVMVLGAGPGGYTAAFRAADLGKKVVLVERYPALGGVCLNVGCIPSKALLHVAKVITEAEEMGEAGVKFGTPQVDLKQLRAWTEGVVGKLTKGLAGLAKQRKVQVIQGVGQFAAPDLIRVKTANGSTTVRFDHAIIAAGSQAARIPGFPYDDPRLMDSTGALALDDLPKRLLVIGGGIIGLELATVYDAIGSRITVVELMDTLIPGCDTDLVRPLHKRIEKRYEAIHLKTTVTRIESRADGLQVSFEGDQAPSPQLFDRILLAVGRRPNGKLIGAEQAGVHVTDRGFITVDRQLRTNVPHIFAIGDIVGEPMLAHKGTHEGKLAAEIIGGVKAKFDARAIPSVAYTDPEVAWMGLTETEARTQGVEVEKAVFPWAASGRALSMGRADGLTKLLFDKQSHRVVGAGMVGTNAGELIAETVLALEMGSEAQDIGLTIHPHPTLSETVFFAAEIAEGSITDLYLPRR